MSTYTELDEQVSAIESTEVRAYSQDPFLALDLMGKYKVSLYWARHENTFVAYLPGNVPAARDADPSAAICKALVAAQKAVAA